MDIAHGLELKSVVATCGEGQIKGLVKGFSYTVHNVSTGDLSSTSSGEGCDCCRSGRQDCGRDCPCARAFNDAESVYSEDGRLLPLLQGNNTSFYPIVECGVACSCSCQCRNRQTQRGLAVRVRLVCVPRKGWAAFAQEPVPAGTFVAQYAGELLTAAEAESRLLAYDSAVAEVGHALLVVREILPSGSTCLRLNIDATCIGNVARFFNHSCDGGNLELVVVRMTGCLVPHVALFARRDIDAGSELTFAYGSPQPGPLAKDSSLEQGTSAVKAWRPCFCGTPSCLGFLPRS